MNWVLQSIYMLLIKKNAELNYLLVNACPQFSRTVEALFTRVWSTVWLSTQSYVQTSEVKVRNKFYMTMPHAIPILSSGKSYKKQQFKFKSTLHTALIWQHMTCGWFLLLRNTSKESNLPMMRKFKRLWRNGCGIDLRILRWIWKTCTILTCVCPAGKERM